MTVQLISQPEPRYIGLSTDTKPTPTSTGGTFWETDTGHFYMAQGGAWSINRAGTPEGLTVTGDLEIEVLRGAVLGHDMLGGLGERESIGTTAAGEDMWRGNELTPAPTSHTTIPTPAAAGEQMTVVSESQADNGTTATGILTVLIHYLDAAGDAQIETVTLDGTTPVDTVATDMRFIQAIHSATVGSGGVADGHIKIYKTGTVGLVYSMIAAGGNMSLVPHRMVPLGKSCYVRGWHATEAQGKRVAFRLRSTDHLGTLFPGVFIFKDVAYLKQAASPHMVVAFKAPALSIIKVTGWAIAINGEGSCAWRGVLVDD